MKHFVKTAVVVSLCSLSLPGGPALAADWSDLGPTTNGAAPAVIAKASDTNSLEMLRTYLQLQEQIHSLQLSVESSRKESDAAATKMAEAFANRLQAIEESLTAQRAREFEAIQGSNHVILILAGTFAAVGVLALLMMAYFQWRTVSRLADMSTVLHPAPGLLLGPPTAQVGTGEANVATSGATERSNARLLEAVDLLEKRITGLEHTARPRLNEGSPSANGPQNDAAAPDASTEAPTGNGPSAGTTSPEAHMTVLLGKGQSLLNLDKLEEAMACFDEALSLEPKNPDALVKKGAVLERLGRVDAAIDCYDRAIAADKSHTIAYLQKGGLFNRMERFTEALECYELALRSQEKPKE
jgi:tetratricopeptide (TPR) repeat protein